MPHYLLSWTTPAERLFDVTIRFTAPADTPRLLLPAWRPGRYLIQNYAANVREWSAGDARVWKDGLTSWRVDARAGEEVTFRYRYYAGQLDAGSSFLDEDEAYFNGSNLFMLVEGLRGEEHRLTIAAPAEWNVETQLRREDAVLVARDYDHLIDSPTIAAAALTRHSFVESGARIHLVFRGDEGLDTEQFVEPVRAIVQSQAELFGGLPFRDYRFLYHVRDRWHGVEHEDSSSIILRRNALLGCGPGDEGYDHLLSITAHELFHAWMVKRIVPGVFSPYDYWKATPTRLLWVMEGVTSYYGELTLVRSGLWSVARYLQHLESEIQLLEAMPAAKHLSLSQASFDGWLSDPAQMHDQPNAFFSFYNKGEVVAALLDLTMRRATEGERGLDDVVRLLWEEYGKTGRGLEEDAMERAVARVADVGDFFARYVDGTGELPYEELLGAAGVAFASTPGTQVALGARLRADGGSLVVESVVRGGAAMDAGVLPHDELLAIGDTRITGEAALAAALKALAPSAELLIARAGVLRRLTLAAKADARPKIALKVAGASALRQAWLRREE
jgi:predicted metalloprotease with PDZ domain